jgi:hypothetical protein
VAAGHQLDGLHGTEGARARGEHLAADRHSGDRENGDNGGREDNAGTSDQAPLAPTAASPRPVSRQGNPFVGRARETPTAVSVKSRLSGRGPARYSRRAAGPLPHLTWCAAWPAARKYRWRTTMPERPWCARYFGQKSHRGLITGR